MEDCTLAGNLEKKPPPQKKRTFSSFLLPGLRAQTEIIPLSWLDWWWGGVSILSKRKAKEREMKKRKGK